MVMDQPIVVYPKDKSQMKNGGHTAEEMNKIAEEHKNRHKSLVGQKISLGEYFKKDIKNENKG